VEYLQLLKKKIKRVLEEEILTHFHAKIRKKQNKNQKVKVVYGLRWQPLDQKAKKQKISQDMLDVII
jgi:hypothetical protein